MTTKTRTTAILVGAVLAAIVGTVLFILGQPPSPLRC